MALEIVKPGDNRYCKSLTFAPAGAGKTTFLGTAQLDERTAPMLFLDFEGGSESLAGLDIDVAPIKSLDDYSEAFEILSDPGCDYKSVGIDSISETHIWMLLSRIAEKGPSRREPDLIEQGDYGVVTTQLRRLLREFRDLPMHVFYVAGAKEIEERGVGKIQVPQMSGQMANEVVQLMSVVGYLAQVEEDDSEDIMRMLLLQNYPGYRTKIRLPWDPENQLEKPDEIEAPTVGKLLDSLHITTSGRKKSRAKKATANDKDKE